MKDDWKYITTESGERFVIGKANSVPSKPKSLVMHWGLSK